MQANPIFLREISEVLRKEAKADSLALVYFGSLASLAVLFPALHWAGIWSPYYSHGLFYILMFLQAVLASSGGDPVGIVARERLQKTFDPLFLTPLHPARYLFGLLQFQFVMILRRLGMALPFYAMIALDGGVDLLQLAAWYVLLPFYAMTVCVITLASTASPRFLSIIQAAQGAKSRRAFGASPVIPGAGFNMVAGLSWLFFPAVAMVAQVVLRQGGPNALLSFSSYLGPDGPFMVNVARSCAILHPFMAIVFWGDVTWFGWVIPVPFFCLATWAFFFFSGCAAFVHHYTMRQFRPAPWLRLGHFTGIAVVQLLIVGVFVQEPGIGAIVCFALGWASLLKEGSFAPLTTPTRPVVERFQLFPRFDIFTHRAGNLIAWRLLALLPTFAAQFHLVTLAEPTRPGISRAFLYMNVALLSCVLIHLSASLMVRMSRELKGRRILATAEAAPAEAAEASTPASAPEGKKPEGEDVNPITALLLVVWILSFPMAYMEDLLAGRSIEWLGKIISSISRPLLVLNPFRLLYEIVIGVMSPIGRGLNIDLTKINLPTIGSIEYILAAAYALGLCAAFTLVVFEASTWHFHRSMAQIEKDAFQRDPAPTS